MVLSLPTGRQGRFLAIAFTLFLIVLIWIGLVSPLMGLYRDQGDALAQKQLLVDHMALLAASLPELKTQAADLQDANAQSPLLDGATDALAAARLQEMLEKMASSSGVTLLSVESLPAEATGASRRIGLKVDLTGTYSSLIDLLTRIDQATPPLLIDELSLQAPQVMNSENDFQLVTSFKVYGFRAGEKAS